MADTQQQPSLPSSPTCMHSVNRIVKLPIIETTLQTASNVYGKVKDLNSVTQWTCETAEGVVNKTIDVSKPLVLNFEGPIKKVDGVLCSGLDYVETKVPAVKLPAGEMYHTTKDYVQSTVGPKIETAYHLVEPAIETAKTAMEFGVHKVEEYLHPATPATEEQQQENPESSHRHEHHEHNQ